MNQTTKDSVLRLSHPFIVIQMRIKLQLRVNKVATMMIRNYLLRISFIFTSKIRGSTP